MKYSVIFVGHKLNSLIMKKLLCLLFVSGLLFACQKEATEQIEPEVVSAEDVVASLLEQYGIDAKIIPTEEVDPNAISLSLDDFRSLMNQPTRSGPISDTQGEGEIKKIDDSTFRMYCYYMLIIDNNRELSFCFAVDIQSLYQDRYNKQYFVNKLWADASNSYGGSMEVPNLMNPMTAISGRSQGYNMALEFNINYAINLGDNTIIFSGNARIDARNFDMNPNYTTRLSVGIQFFF